jgi:signal peptidase II
LRILSLTAILTLAVDQASKLAVLYGADLLGRGAIDVLPPLLNFRLAWNRGVNFGLFSNDADVMRWILIAVALVISAFVARWVSRLPGVWAGVFGGLVIGGALGNALDRVLYGAVADFLNMACCGIRNPYAFNVADVAIFAGVFGLVLFTGENRKQKAANGDEGT